VPDAPYLDPSLLIAWRAPGTLQVGLDSPQAIALAGVSDALPALLRRLTGEPAASQVLPLARSLGLEEELCTAVGLLVSAGLVTDGPPRRGHEHAWVEVIGDGPLADRVQAGLRDVGIGRASRVLAASGPGPDVVVVAPHGRRGMTEADSLMAFGTPHLWTHVRDRAAVVGPLVLPGRTGCLRCHDLHRTDADPAWPTLVLAWEQDARGCDDPAVVAVAGALAVRHVVLLLQGLHPATLDAILSERPDGSLRVEPCPQHPGCGCGWGTDDDG
jgi:hypothetical protein